MAPDPDPTLGDDERPEPAPRPTPGAPPDPAREALATSGPQSQPGPIAPASSGPDSPVARSGVGAIANPTDNDEGIEPDRDSRVGARVPPPSPLRRPAPAAGPGSA